jgi:hypothetical protein
MNISEDEATKSIDALLQACTKLEESLKATYGEKAHEWLFAVREVLYDLRRLNLVLSAACNVEDPGSAPLQLRSFARVLLYEFIPHVQGHMEELDQELPADASDEEDSARRTQQ